MKIRIILVFSVDCITQSELISVTRIPFWKNKIKHNKNMHTDSSKRFVIYMLYTMILYTRIIISQTFGKIVSDFFIHLLYTYIFTSKMYLYYI